MKPLLFIVILFSTIACSVKSRDPQEPVRLKGIPVDAFWIGGPDGGNWYFVEEIHNHKNNAIIKVFNDTDGKLIVSKRFILICPIDNQQFIGNLKIQIAGFDGEKILLKSVNGKKSCWLQ